MKGHVVTVG